MTGTWASGWATSDVGSAVEFAKGVGSIFDSTLGAPAASIDITSIPATYAHLWIVVYARGDAAGASGALVARFNGDAGASYDYESLLGKGTTASALEAFAQTSFGVSNGLPQAAANANLFGSYMIFVPHYAGSSNNKSAVSISGSRADTTTTSMQANHVGGFWRSSAAINRVTILPAAGNLVAGSRATVYVVGA